VAAYFDVTDADDLAYLPLQYRTATDVDVVAPQAEADVIGRYTAPVRDLSTAAWDLVAAAPLTSDLATGRTWTDLGDGTAVYLRSYEEDAADVTDAAFLVAMKRAIADAIVWKLLQQQRDTASTGQATTGSGSRQWAPGHDAPLPKHLERHLARWDTREPCWGI
jgi:hypothetical protein